MKRIFITLLLGAAALMAVAPTISQATGVRSRSHANHAKQLFIVKSSHKSFNSTISQLKHSVASNGMMVLGDLNQAGALSTTGLHLAGAHAFFIGNPVTGKKLFQMNPAVGQVLPIRVYVWVNNKGKTEIGYFRPSTLLGDVNHQLKKMAGPMMDKTFAKVVAGAAG